MLRLTLGLLHLVADACRMLYSHVQFLSRNLSDLIVASSQYDLLLFSETMLSDWHHISKLLVPGFGYPVMLFRDRMSWARMMVAYFRDGYGHFANPNLSAVVANAVIWCVCCAGQNFYVFCLYYNPDLDDWI